MGNTVEEPSSIRSKLSFSSTTSILSAEEHLEGDGPLTPTDKMEDDVEDEDDDLSSLNSILQAGSPGSLSDEEEEDVDDLPTEHDSASPLSSVPDDFPLSPEIPPTTIVEELSLEEEEEEEEPTVNFKKRRKENTKLNTDKNEENDDRPIKKVKSSEDEERRESNSSQEEFTKKRRASRTSLDIPEAPRTRRRSRQEEKDVVMEENVIENIQQDDELLPDNKEEDIKKEESPKEGLTPPEKTENEEENEVDNEVQDKNNQDYQQRHKEALDALTHIEIEFARLRDRMYQEKMSELNEEAIMIANGTHPELVSLMAEIEEKKGRRVNNAEAWRRHQHANFKQQFEGFEYQANIHFISQKNALRRTLLDSLHGRKWTIEDERSKLSESSKVGLPDGREIVARKKENKQDINELQDIKEILGFPMAPNPPGLTTQDVDDDLKILGL